jgi:hypothetical protein
MSDLFETIFPWAAIVVGVFLAVENGGETIFVLGGIFQVAAGSFILGVMFADRNSA